MSVGERPAPLLIAGPQGSGKTTLAQWVHQRGERALRPLIPFDCRTAEGDAFELMFFGRAPRVQGGTERPGILEIAHGATLLLENVDCLPAAFQPAVAEFLESGQVRRLGSHTMLRPDVRIIATATTPTDVARGAARPSDIDLDAWHDSTGSDTDGRTGLLDNVDDDLRGRLSDLTVCLPPLRARQVDIPELAERIYQRLTRRAPRLPVRLSPRAIGVLKQADWPGNVRQMADVLFRAAIATGDATVGAAAVESALCATARAYGPTCIEESGDYSDASTSLAGRTLAEIERRSIVETIRSTGGNKAKAARLLGVSEKTIYNKIRHYGLRAELPS
jgi:DNA-binding NtrC family response regulator